MPLIELHGGGIGRNDGMWKCELCNRKFNEDIMAIELKFGYLDSEQAKEEECQHNAFYTEEAVGPICDDCAIAYIKGEEIVYNNED